VVVTLKDRLLSPIAHCITDAEAVACDDRDMKSLVAFADIHELDIERPQARSLIRQSLSSNVGCIDENLGQRAHCGLYVRTV
jgi:hypothetical protein